MIGLDQDKQKAISQKAEDIKVWDKYYIDKKELAQNSGSFVINCIPLPQSHIH